MLSDRERAMLTMAAILTGRPGELAGCDLWNFLPAIGVKKMPMARPTGGFTYRDWVVFLKKEDGQVVAEQIYSAGTYDATMIRAIVGYGETCSKNCGLEEDTLPTVMELAEQL